MRSFAKVFLVIFFPIFFALVLTFYFVHDGMITNARSELLEEMKNKWIILATQNEISDLSSPKNYARLTGITQKTSLRITVVNHLGKVLFDSRMPLNEIADMENHKSRPEIKDAIYSVEGFATRFSSTMNMQMFYYARVLSQDRVLRLAYPATYVESIQQRFTQQSIWAFISLSLVVLMLALYFARKVSLPIQRLNYIADTIESGRNHVHFPRFKDPSMAKIAGLIYRIYSSMQKKNIELTRDQQKLNHIFSTMDQGVLLLDKDDVILHANLWMIKEFGIEFTPGGSLYQSTNDIHLINFFSGILEQETETARASLHQEVFDISIKIVGDQKLLLIRNLTKLVEYEAFKTELTGNISHELKTPLAMIMGYAETLRDTPNIEEKTRIRFLDNIYNSTVRLNDLINDIIELHKLESVGNTFRVTDAVLLTDIALEIESYYAECSKKIHISTSTDSFRILPEHIQSVLTNLIDNACKYSEGEIVTVGMDRKGTQLYICVADQGPQISEADRKRIFERFYTCSRSRNKEHSGTGLGLSIVKHIANLYHGNVQVETNAAGGNSFSVVLNEKPIE